MRDSGPDRELYRAGEPVEFQLIGRSTTGSGVIGRTVVDYATEQVTSTGRPAEPFPQGVCAALGL